MLFAFVILGSLLSAALFSDKTNDALSVIHCYDERSPADLHVILVQADAPCVDNISPAAICAADAYVLRDILSKFDDAVNQQRHSNVDQARSLEFLVGKLAGDFMATDRIYMTKSRRDGATLIMHVNFLREINIDRLPMPVDAVFILPMNQVPVGIEEIRLEFTERFSPTPGVEYAMCDPIRFELEGTQWWRNRSALRSTIDREVLRIFSECRVTDDICIPLATVRRLPQSN